MLLNLVPKNEISHKIIYHFMTSYGSISMILVDSCIIWFHLCCIMQLKKSHYIATNVSSRKSANTFDDIPDCLYHIIFIQQLKPMLYTAVTPERSVVTPLLLIPYYIYLTAYSDGLALHRGNSRAFCGNSIATNALELPHPCAIPST